GQPLVILEAMSLGIPVIATRVGDIPDMLGEDYAFLFNPREPNMLLKTILNFDEVPGKDEIGKVLLNRYMANYSQDVFKRNIYELFKVR
ncbi:MAG TPA: glycosyltransferase, partial [Tenuifilaceae bacterium]|nr:glycosyltransferase [Tenuifilaceae bacterium]